MRTCRKCGIEKELILFRKNGKYITYKCKECCNSPFRTGIPNAGRFKKGIIPSTAWKKGHLTWNKGLKSTIAPWNKGKKNIYSESTLKKLKEANIGKKQTKETIEKRCDKLRKGKKRRSWKYNEWSLSVKERDNWTCQHCGLKDKKKLHSHHIVPWKDNLELRFELSNGLTLCRSCHRIEDIRIKPLIAWNKGKKLTADHKNKLSKAKKGKTPWNKGKKLIIDIETNERKWINL